DQTEGVVLRRQRQRSLRRVLCDGAEKITNTLGANHATLPHRRLRLLPACSYAASGVRRCAEEAEHSSHLPRRPVLQDSRLLSRIVALGANSEYRRAGEIWSAVPRCVSRRVVHAVARLDAHRAPTARHSVDADGREVSCKYLRPEAMPILARALS